MSEVSPYVMVCCHQGAEGALKRDAAAQGWRLAFSRPGFVTFKHDPLPQAGSQKVEPLTGVFARTTSWSIGRIAADNTADINTGEMGSKILEMLAASGSAKTFAGLHVWARDRLPVGEFDYEPGIEPLTIAVAEQLEVRLVEAGIVPPRATNQIAQVGDVVLDLIIVDPGSWMLGWHVASEFVPSRWPGGIPPFDDEHEAVSRAYFKAAEAFMWSGLPIEPGQVAVEIGSAPGGAAQRMLEMGLKVIGVDPAEMDPEIAANPNFRHIRARGGDIKRAEYREAEWLLVDSTVRPDKTLVTVENIVTNDQVHIRGMLLTMKLGTYEAAHRIPGWCHTLAGWGYKQVEVRQLATGRCEVCIAARKT